MEGNILWTKAMRASPVFMYSVKLCCEVPLHMSMYLLPPGLKNFRQKFMFCTKYCNHIWCECINCTDVSAPNYQVTTDP